MTLIGAYILMIPDSIVTSRMYPVLNLVGWWPQFLGVLFLVPSMGRLSGLYFASRLGIWGFRLRAIGAALGGLTWLQLATALSIFSYSNGISTSPMVCLYIALAAGEFISTYRAQADGKSEPR